MIAARRLSGREEFHRRVFETLLGGAWQRQELALEAGDAAAVQALLARWVAEAPALDEFGLMRLLAARQPLRLLTAATGLPPAAFLRQVLALGDADLRQPQALPAWKRAKLAALGDAALLAPAALEAWEALDAVQARIAAIAALDTCPLDAGLAAATAAIGAWLAGKPAVDALPPRYLGLLQNSAFLVSYLADPGRHDFKRAIARQAAHMLSPLRSAAVPARQPSAAARPRLTIVGELLFPAHAMYRCYAEALAELPQQFDVTLVTDEPTRCPEHAGFSQRQLYFAPHERDAGVIARLVRSSEPDIVLYPSVGMTFWTFALSQLRLAPLQLMSVGHPAPGCSEHIDGTLLYRDLARAPLPDYGLLIPYDRQPLPSAPPSGWQARSGATQAGAPRVVAVNAAAMKLNPRFLGLLRQLLEQAPPRTELHFFPNLHGLELAGLRRELGAWFPEALVHASTGYADYMNLMARADLLLQSFPFGGTNTAMDALALGLPMVCLRSADLPALVDPVLLEHAGLGELCADSSEDYLRLASRLLNDAAELERMRGLARGALARLQAAEVAGTTSMADAILATWRARAP